ncbi:hypothetical protein PFISCL1PPCAC_10597 [Pristionchus fissidentatus]|uniref:Glutamyl-tRNA(Gln) amidotransferase subunit B, mitochondrial n=1 Tax=Pristionchus fissidentatus TaxID=1538716 RepID=A0AAV5VKZ2_9BILA|nr:hypothetical protein PFISCL1PPCAC_10597 [Pristionchus fissidentatus]
MSSLRAVVGLEVHVQLSTRTKLFSRSPSLSLPPNESVSPLDAAHPGVLPLLSTQAVKLAIRSALLLNCEVNRASSFDRKHYFYADMPAGYQITQQASPIAKKGRFDFHLLNENEELIKTVEVLQIQLEQDSGKSIHEEKESLIDLNRSGCALVEIVTAPELSSGLEAASFVRQLRLLFMHHGISNGLMHKGQMRVDANVSISNEKWNGQRTEIKNMNSIADVESAIEYEINRQKEIVKRGDKVIFETRTVDTQGRTVCMREKAKTDYRFMHEPNIPTLRISDSFMNESVLNVRSTTPLYKKLISDCGFSPKSAVHMSEDEDLSLFISHCCEKGNGMDSLPSIGGNLFMEWMLEMKQLCQRRRINYPPTRTGFHREFLTLIRLTRDANITRLTAIDVLRELIETDMMIEVEKFVNDNTLWRILDEIEMEREAKIVLEGWTDNEKKKASIGHKKRRLKLRNELIARSGKRIDVDDAMKTIERLL